jgi:hypothetical protein
MSEEKLNELEKRAKDTPLGWRINLYFILLQCISILMEKIDSELKQFGSTFRQDKKYAYGQYVALQKKAQVWLDKINVDGAFWDATYHNARRYDNSIADANELIREMMLYIDRSWSQENFYKIFRFLRQLPSGDRFPEEEIAKYNFKRPWVIGIDDRVKTEFGDGTIIAEGNKNSWVINLDNGAQKVLDESQFEQI